MGCISSSSSTKQDGVDELDFKIKANVYNDNNLNNAIELEDLVMNYIKTTKTYEFKSKREEIFTKKIVILLNKIQLDMISLMRKEETKFDQSTNNNDKRVLVSLNLIRRHLGSIYNQIDNDINKTISLLNEREIFVDEMTDDDLSSTGKTPSTSSHKKTDVQPVKCTDIENLSDSKFSNKDDIIPCKISPKKALIVDQSKKTVSTPVVFKKLIESPRSSDSLRLSGHSVDSSEDYGFIDLSIHDDSNIIGIRERTGSYF